MTKLERFVLTGCSGGGKSTLLAELARRGEQVVPEAGRALVREQMAKGGDLLPWADPIGFTLELARKTIEAWDAAPKGRVFFDRGLIDVLAHLTFLGKCPPDWLDRAASRMCYASPIFAVPPWEEIYADDGERGKDFAQALSEYEALCAAYACHGYDRIEVPRLSVKKRADFLLATL